MRLEPIMQFGTAIQDARNLEALYQRMWDRHAAGETPAMIDLR